MKWIFNTEEYQPLFLDKEICLLVIDYYCIRIMRYIKSDSIYIDIFPDDDDMSNLFDKLNYNKIFDIQDLEKCKQHVEDFITIFQKFKVFL